MYMLQLTAKQVLLPAVTVMLLHATTNLMMSVRVNLRYGVTSTSAMLSCSWQCCNICKALL